MSFLQKIQEKLFQKNSKPEEKPVKTELKYTGKAVFIGKPVDQIDEILKQFQNDY